MIFCYCISLDCKKFEENWFKNVEKIDLKKILFFCVLVFPSHMETFMRPAQL